MSPSTPFLSVIIPCYNEEARIGPTLDIVDDFLNRQPYQSELIVVDDGSSDQSRDLLFEASKRIKNLKLLTQEKNQGKGWAVKTGFENSRGSTILFMDADLSTPIECLTDLLNWAKTYEVVIGSRRVKGAVLTKRQPIYREFSGRVFSVLVRTFLFHGYLDTQCGFKLFRRRAAQDLFRNQTIHGFGFDIELLYLALKKFNYKVKEAPVQWTNSKDSRVRLMKDSLRMFLDIFHILRNNRNNVYQ